MTMRAAQFAAVALALTSQAAGAAVPAILKTPPAPGSVGAAAGIPPAPASTQTPPKGIPGYYDPASRTFTPLAIPLSAGQPTSVKSTVTVRTYYGSPPGHGPTLGIGALFLFGILQGGSAPSQSPASPAFVVQQNNEASAAYPAGPSSETFSTSSVTGSPYVQIRINCGYSSPTVSYTTSVFVAQQAVKGGAMPVDATCNL